MTRTTATVRQVLLLMCDARGRFTRLRAAITKPVGAGSAVPAPCWPPSSSPCSGPTERTRR